MIAIIITALAFGATIVVLFDISRTVYRIRYSRDSRRDETPVEFLERYIENTREALLANRRAASIAVRAATKAVE